MRLCILDLHFRETQTARHGNTATRNAKKDINMDNTLAFPKQITIEKFTIHTSS